MSCYHWELEAIIEGLRYRSLDFRELLAVQVFNQRYVNNAKKPNFKKVFNRPKEEGKIIKLFGNQQNQIEHRPNFKGFVSRQRALAERLAKGGK